ncbi:peptide chain release factor N(5)-glutamine methyltransferase [Euryhalocaulis caribicus]|uniref:peptide chain release factor N(5)-glutamine methyltransferase n=1 Tax=Euryhalocaulis caribicus TaxID=1161401 RepID=UPI0003AA2F67|nr:peptide chain release factor N(5)-glutamine methyltransferase [Euryhalocaulis caribicus]
MKTANRQNRVGALRRSLASRLAAAGNETPDLDARLLIQHVTGLSREWLAAAPEAEMTGAQAAALETLAARRLAGEPVAHLTGSKPFWSFELRSDARALTPRPDTEIIVEAALERLPAGRPSRILDLGVGSGAILLALLTERPEAFGVGADRSAGALALTRENAAQLGLADRVALMQGDWAAAIDARFDLVASNPPYIPTADLAALAPEVQRDPRAALDGGADGLTAYRALAACLPSLLAPGGSAVLELGAGQAEAVSALMESAGKLAVDECRADLAGHGRALLISLVC